MDKYVKIVERVTWTAIQAGAADLLVRQEVTWEALKLAGVAAVLAAAKCVVRLQVGNKNEPSVP